MRNTNQLVIQILYTHSIFLNLLLTTVLTINKAASPFKWPLGMRGWEATRHPTNTKTTHHLHLTGHCFRCLPFLIYRNNKAGSKKLYESRTVLTSAPYGTGKLLLLSWFVLEIVNNAPTTTNNVPSWLKVSDLVQGNFHNINWETKIIVNCKL